jgi:PAS domain S-box-containing protein
MTSHVFTAERATLLELVASQAAILLENASLYKDLQEREAKVRRLVDANIIGIFIWDLAGQIIDANEAFLRIVAYGRHDFVSRTLRWTELTPAEWSDSDEIALEEINATGAAQPYEKEFLRKDGNRVPVLIGAAAFGGRPDQGIAFVIDLTEHKRTEEKAHEIERRYHAVQMELAHANRVATMGQLTASIAHEVQQPIAATAMHGIAALRWLRAQPANLEEAGLALDRIVSDTKRAGAIVGRIRDLVEKAPAREDYVDINEAIREMIELTRGEAVKTGVSVRTHLADGLPLIRGDHVQLQQVNLNLIINAIEAMTGMAEAPRELLVTTGLTEPIGVLVAVRDSGPGLAPTTLERLFDPFYTTKPGGLGMGLSICRSIIKRHGGRLWAVMNKPRGAIFQFTLPARSDGAS